MSPIYFATITPSLISMAKPNKIEIYIDPAKYSVFEKNAVKTIMRKVVVRGSDRNFLSKCIS